MSKDIWRTVTKEEYRRVAEEIVKERKFPMEGHTTRICEPAISFGFYDDEAVVDGQFDPSLARVRIVHDYDLDTGENKLRYGVNTRYE